MVTKTLGSTWNYLDNVASLSILDTGASPSALDNHDAIALALTNAISAGIAVYVPDGVYTTSPITLNTGARIEGPGTLKLLGSATDFLLSIVGTCKVQGITLDGNNSVVYGGNYGCLKLAASSNSLIKDVSINNPLGDGIYITNASTDTDIKGVKVTNNMRNGITVDSATGLDILNFRCLAPANTANPGSGLSITSAGAAVSNVSVVNAVVKGAKFNGIDVVGNGSRNITNVSFSNCRVIGSTGDGIRIKLAEEILISNSVVGTNTIDGIRIEGDTQNCRVSNCVANGNTGVGISEVISGSTPNKNGFIYNVQVNNGTNVTVPVGSTSFVVGP